MDQHKPKNVAVVGDGEKYVRVAWTLLFYDEAFKHDYALGCSETNGAHIKAE